MIAAQSRPFRGDDSRILGTYGPIREAQVEDHTHTGGVFLTPPAGFMPHGHCFLWQSDVWWMWVIGDGGMGVFYTAIPILILFLYYRRPGVFPRWAAWAFSTFIFLCGLTHFFSLYTIYVPHYRIYGWLKLAAAFSSFPALFALFRAAAVQKEMLTPAEVEEEVTAAVDIRMSILASMLGRSPVAKFLIGTRPTRWKGGAPHHLDRGGRELYVHWCAGRALSQSRLKAPDLLGQALRDVIPHREDIINEYWRAAKHPDSAYANTLVHISESGRLFSTTFTSASADAAPIVAAAVTVDLTSLRTETRDNLRRVSRLITKIRGASHVNA